MPRHLLHYEIYNHSEAAPWLVFVHGAGGAIASWNYQREAFKDFFNLLFLDLRDHGKSKGMAPEHPKYNFDIICTDILCVLDHLGISSAHFMSLSMGSVLLQRLDDLRPGLVDSQIFAGGVFRGNWRIHLFAHGGKMLSHILTYQQLYTLFSWLVMPKKNHAFARRVYRMQSRLLSPREYLKWISLYREFFGVLRRYFRKPLLTPSLVVMGSQDHIFLDAARRFASRHAQAHLQIIERCGHICNIEQPDTFNKLALEFLTAK